MASHPLAGRVIAVTGAARGIGREIAAQLALQGARVALGDRDGGAVRATARELPGSVAAVDLDVTDTGSFTAFLAAKLSPAGEATYAATKHGVFGYLNGVREELHRSGVQLTVVMPGVVDTELAAGTASGAAKFLQPIDVARAVIAAIERPRFEVTVPRYVGPLVRWVNVLPQAGRDFLLRKMVPNQITALTDRSVRRSYETHNVTATDTTGV